MMEFIADLDDYFCEMYADYHRICSLHGYSMPKMHETVRDENGMYHSYTLPKNTMRLAAQPRKDELLATIKQKHVDLTFSFSFVPVKMYRRIFNVFSKSAFNKWLKHNFAKYHQDAKEIGAQLNVLPEIWDNICAGKFEPSKNLIFSIALTAQWSVKDTVNVLHACGEDFDFEYPKDVVVSYLLEKRIFNREMIDAALAEYKIDNLFLLEN